MSVRNDLEISTQKDNEEVKIEFDAESVNWYELRVEGRQPERRAHHSSFTLNNKMYIFGGYDIREGPLSNMWSFDLAKIGNLTNDSTQSLQTPLNWQEVKTIGVKQPGK
jgi:hypothetical protein